MRSAVGGCGVALLACVAQIACSAPRAAVPSQRGSLSVAQPPQRGGVSPDVARFRSARHYTITGRPVAIRIPSIGVTSSLQALGRNPDGTVEVPHDWDVAGWYEKSARPGAPGPAIVLGHVDSRLGPAVFYRLSELRRGDEVLVKQRGGKEIAFVVERVEQHDKEAFPTDAVYLPTLQPTLRLVTCGGTFDHSIGHYRDNIIVFAHLARAA
jgi:sortase (surface protein transpeptidase)